MRSTKRRRRAAASESDTENEGLPTQTKHAINTMEERVAGLSQEVSALRNELEELRKLRDNLEAQGVLLLGAQAQADAEVTTSRCLEKSSLPKALVSELESNSGQSTAKMASPGSIPGHAEADSPRIFCRTSSGSASCMVPGSVVGHARTCDESVVAAQLGECEPGCQQADADIFNKLLQQISRDSSTDASTTVQLHNATLGAAPSTATGSSTRSSAEALQPTSFHATHGLVSDRSMPNDFHRAHDVAIRDQAVLTTAPGSEIRQQEAQNILQQQQQVEEQQQHDHSDWTLLIAQQQQQQVRNSLLAPSSMAQQLFSQLPAHPHHHHQNHHQQHLHEQHQQRNKLETDSPRLRLHQAAVLEHQHQQLLQQRTTSNSSGGGCVLPYTCGEYGSAGAASGGAGSGAGAWRGGSHDSGVVGMEERGRVGPHAIQAGIGVPACTTGHHNATSECAVTEALPYEQQQQLVRHAAWRGGPWFTFRGAGDHPHAAASATALQPYPLQPLQSLQPPPSVAAAAAAVTGVAAATPHPSLYQRQRALPYHHSMPAHMPLPYTVTAAAGPYRHSLPGPPPAPYTACRGVAAAVAAPAQPPQPPPFQPLGYVAKTTAWRRTT
ncbi:hypothetical protein Agub_g14256 [Astrephomene gubernaculifera]|uniref:Uncharacterized protein n=1 Tax=Astrephomene gubernaculifera TaxID=47775 RepID=A0AAD3E2S8_9CHLO|nr:hypothetical protein Agub_g14256 [Astrephomene gubernaculifera]